MLGVASRALDWSAALRDCAQIDGLLFLDVEGDRPVLRQQVAKLATRHAVDHEVHRAQGAPGVQDDLG